MMQPNQQGTDDSRQRIRNRFGFGIGTIGRDAVYTMISMYLMFYLTDVLRVPTATMWWVTAAIIFTKAFDAFNDPFMGILVDNTKSRWGKFKPWILFGVLTSAVMSVLMFTDFHLRGMEYVLIFLLVYVLWEISFTANDISYWSMLPALSRDQKERERIGAVARICANIGLFGMVVCITPITEALGRAAGSLQLGYFWLSVIVCGVMIAFQMVTLVFVKEETAAEVSDENKTKIRDLLTIILKNDQLLWVVLAMTLFHTGYTTTTSFGQYYFKYYQGDLNMYPVFGLILGVAQILSLLIFPLVRRKFKREPIYAAATVIILVGYVVFLAAPQGTVFGVAAGGLLIFIGDAAIQLIMLMQISDCVEYGEWKSEKRNESMTVSLQPFIFKVASSLASGIVGITVILSGMKEALTPADMTANGMNLFRFAMFIFPMICIVVSYLIYRRKYVINEDRYATIQADLAERRSR